MRGRGAVAATAAALAVAVVGGGMAAAQSSGAPAGEGRAAHGSTMASAVGKPAAASSASRIVVKDIVIRVRDQQPVSAYLVKPEGRLRPGSSAGALWLHWLGQIHNDRTEFLGEAVSLAQRGVVSVLRRATSRGFPTRWAARTTSRWSETRSRRCMQPWIG
jgi:hypothetical protein